MVRFLSWLTTAAIGLSSFVRGQSDYPLCGVTPYSYTQAANTYNLYKEALKRLSNVTVASWYTDNDANSYTSIQKLLNQCGADTLPVIVVYGLPNKDCSAGESNSGSNKNADAYEKWIQQLADLIDTDKVIYITDTTYGCQVTVSNLSPLPVRDVQLLLQIPQGAIPVNYDGFYTRSTTFDLGGNETETVVFCFYFPSPGKYCHFGAHVAIQNYTVRWAQGSQFDVVERIHTIDSTSWNDVSARGSLNDVLAFLNKHPKLETLDLTRIRWRLKARDSYDAIIAFLRNNFVYNLNVFQYAFYHKDTTGIRDVLQHSPNFLNQVGPGINGIAGAITIFDSVPELAIQSCLELAEFTPYIIRRVHPSNTKPSVNRELQTYYQSLCAKFALLPSLHSLDYLVLVYFLVVFNRIDTALDCFPRINKQLVPSLQYDYMAGYLSFYGSDSSFTLARTVAQTYRDYSDPTWRERFQALGNQLKTLDALMSRGPQALAAGNVEDMMLSMTVNRDSIVLEQKGHRVSSGTLRFYPVDVEVMFSTNPFAMKKVKSMPLVQPRVSLPVDKLSTLTTIPIPSELQSLQMLVAFTPDKYPELEQMQPHFCDSMDVDFRIEEGICQVFSSKKPLARAYVKVFAQTKTNESYEMYKDGYTDVCGCFEYMGINDTKLLLQVSLLSILILDKEHGALVRQVSPPSSKITQ
ncbi:hypothetical protein THRCLA_00011 [Thraustotheca clavata]|uniref:Secreted protein n=1 Tax=Thraustotheca clavata TaxID=74557 RepID=A0A1W0ACK1_9STRA|nr:hypothetical protein THRCLA_00011 [Thraustotheca clavata]